jgi:hypothetical protein
MKELTTRNLPDDKTMLSDLGGQGVSCPHGRGEMGPAGLEPATSGL